MAYEKETILILDEQCSFIDFASHRKEGNNERDAVFLRRNGEQIELMNNRDVPIGDFY